ncbi:PREDICTED: sex comb on midleg-like protein 4, partial [Merops nubicus]|uniref:sex comb on midleg-like protein 4 n=1 Tax=Merops nubicus TaxID=57421 RepID=UPI0004F0BD4F
TNDTSSFHNISILKAASSTTGPDLNSLKREPSRILNKDPSTWSIEEVMRFVKEADPQALAPHAELFRRHEIDGKALLLLRSDMIMKYMGLKLGPALKLCYHIERLKQGKFPEGLSAVPGLGRALDVVALQHRVLGQVPFEGKVFGGDPRQALDLAAEYGGHGVLDGDDDFGCLR